MSGQAETLVIINHSAARARAAWAVVRRVLADAGVAFDAHEAREFGDARTQARAALGAGYRTVAVVGGDGTLSEVVNGFFADENAARREPPAGSLNSVAALAMLPAGTGNDFARALEGRRATLEEWIARLVRHCRDTRDDGDTTRAVDVLRGTVGDDARSFFCLNAVTLGIGAEVAARVAAQGNLVRKLSGEARFALAASASLARWRERRVRVSVDAAEAFECATNLIAVVNSRFAGGGMMFSPEARVDDGLLDVVTARQISRPVLVREMTRIHAGGHVKNPRVLVTRGARVRIEPVTNADSLPVEADGDVRGRTPLELEVMPGALRVVI
jgi:diacylglycerol kinase (ATP)